MPHLDSIQTFLCENVNPDADQLSPQHDLIEAGILDSLTLVHLVTHLEKTFSIRVEPQEFNIENFRTLASISAYTEAKINTPKQT